MNQEGIELAPITEEQRLAALKTAHRYATSIEETAMFAQMLGIIPTTEHATCSRCGSLLEATSDKLWRERRGDLCAACYRKDLKARKAVDA
jgi:hypothetical protein